MNTAPQSGAARAVTGWSVAGLVLLVPSVVMAWLAVVSTPRGGNCLMYGEECSTVPHEALEGCFWFALAVGLLALVWPRTRWTGARTGTVLVQWGAQLTLIALILSGA
ncbi:hypothetical protein OG802_18740 [Streptomyces sp. NBC_00704]|uniref:hypothetical protein n=1 Tax=Streptomyces sp. NBC_00704 TaxID=2975809 RepID=UPI002E3376ED|nr:hypothetical protein [Streptomyces sp. NBC_00704]